MKTMHSYCHDPFGMIDEELTRYREERSMEFEKALRNVNIPKRPGLGIVFSNPFGLDGLEDFKCIVELDCDESLVLAKFIPDKKDYYDVMLVY